MDLVFYFPKSFVTRCVRVFGVPAQYSSFSGWISKEQVGV